MIIEKIQEAEDLVFSLFKDKEIKIKLCNKRPKKKIKRSQTAQNINFNFPSKIQQQK